MCRQCAEHPRTEREAGPFVWLSCLATFGTPSDLWTLAARLVVARYRIGSRVVRIDDRWALVVSQDQPGGGSQFTLGVGAPIVVPAGCALIVECVESGEGPHYYPLALIEPYHWSLGDWGSVDGVASRLNHEVLPALNAAVGLAEGAV